MENLIIIGARGYGREVFHLAQDEIRASRQLTIKGFLDDKSDALGGMTGYPPILSSVEDYLPVPGDVFVCALGEVKSKVKYAQIILEKGGKFTSIIHPTAVIRPNKTIGTGCIIHSHAAVSSEVTVGDFVTLQTHAVVGHDAVIGSWCHLGSFVFVGGKAVLEEGATVYTHTTVLPKISVGKHAFVGAGSVVLKDVKPHTTVFGNPARIIS